jgi:hypothetical protein
VELESLALPIDGGKPKLRASFRGLREEFNSYHTQEGLIWNTAHLE